MKITKKVIVTLAGPTALAVVAVLMPTSAFAQTTLQGGIADARPEGVPSQLIGGDQSIFTIVVNLLLYIIGAISVIMLIIGGIRYTISAGDSGNVTAAKNTILYAIVGLVVAFLAYAIVNFVLVNVGKAV